MTAKPTVPKLEVLMAATLAGLRALGGSASNAELHDWIADHLALAEAVRALPHKSGPTTQLWYKLHWARSFLKAAGAVTNSERGVWTITEAGRRRRPDEMSAIRRKVHNESRLRREERKSQVQAPGSASAAASDGDPELAEETTWTEHLLTTLLAMPPDGFERLCRRLLLESGFVNPEVTGRTGDGGIDGYGVLRIKLVSFNVLFQAKRWKGSVGAATVRDFRGAMVGRADKGLIITTGTFTADARKEARRDGAPAIDLVDGEDLCGLLKELELGVSVRMVPKITVDPAFFAAL